MLFLTPNQQCQGTEGRWVIASVTNGTLTELQLIPDVFHLTASLSTVETNTNHKTQTCTSKPGSNLLGDMVYISNDTVPLQSNDTVPLQSDDSVPLANTADGTVLLGPDLQNIVRQSYERLTKSDVHLQNILRRMQSFS